MQHFVRDRGRAGSPQNGQPGINPKRQAVAANARVSLKQPLAAQQLQGQSVIPSRGFGNAQNSSAVLQQAPQRRHSGQGQDQKHDPYDTDLESLDTTVDQSVIQVEDSQKRDQQHHQQDQVVDPGGGSDGDEESEEEGGSDDDEFSQEEMRLLEQGGYQNDPRESQLAFLQNLPPDFRTVDGDSYPTTTDGQPTEWEGGQEPPSDERDNRGLVSPSPQRPIVNAQPTRPFAPDFLQREQIPNMPGTNHNLQRSSNLWQQSADIRDQQRSNPHLTQRGGRTFPPNAATLPSSQPPTYSQANPKVAPAPPFHSNSHQNSRGQINRPPQHAQRQLPAPVQVQFQDLRPIEPAAPSKRPSSTRAKMVPVFQQQPAEQEPVEEFNAAPDGDYDHETLFAMSYDQLKNEGFDTDPRAGPPVLADDVLEKPLVERLEFVQKNLDARQQSNFFHSLPTTEWEDAGDWFLDQFSSIIQRTKEARQNKRKLAREFEDEVEKRHKHVSKKQNQVGEALTKMKMQGEGLVPKSPRASKSPRPKKG